MNELFKSVFNTLRKNVKFESLVLFLYLIKCLTISVSYEDALVFISLSALSGFKTYNARFEIRESMDEKHKKQTEEEIKSLKHSLSLLTTFTGMSKRGGQTEEPKRYF